jgi:hypothetical protein
MRCAHPRASWRSEAASDDWIKKRGATYLQGYNCQIAVGGVAQVIRAEPVTNQAPDQEH